MKRQYEKEQLIFSLLAILMIFEIIGISMFIKVKYRTYSIISSVVVTEGYSKSYVQDQELKSLQNNKYLYLNDKRYQYNIVSIEKQVIKAQNKWYHEVILQFHIPKKYKDNDTIHLSIYQKKEKLYHIFKTCWESDV